VSAVEIKLIEIIMTTSHLLYSFRRCPYAMRARMALAVSGVPVSIHEVDLKNKPPAMLEISPKGTVPVLQTADGRVIEESIEIMLWALGQNDPEGWMSCERAAFDALVAENDGPFKRALDRYKYPSRYPDEDCSGAREEGLQILKRWDERIFGCGFLCGDKLSAADIALFPFVRQFSKVEPEWFAAQDIKALHSWLKDRLESSLFTKIMQKNLSELP